MRTVQDERSEFRQSLFDAGVLVPTGVDGVYLRSRTFEEVIQGIDRLASKTGADQLADTYYFPLVVPRAVIEGTDYVRSFPNLAGSISSYSRGEAGYSALIEAVDAGEDWSQYFDATDLALCSAACHPLYPTLPTQLPEGGRRFEIFGNCFRHEPSVDPARMQVFRQHEFVFVGEPELAMQHRDLWVQRGLEVHEALQLEIRAVVANDPFFGRFGEMLSANQIDETLKIELVCPIFSEEEPTAITSANAHLDHFGISYGLRTPDGSVAHSACVGFGLERIALALFHTHGLEPRKWPAAVRARLEP